MTKVLHLITRFLDGGAEKTTVRTIKTLLDSDHPYDVRLGVGAEYDPDRLSELPVDSHAFQSLRHYNPAAAVVAIFEVGKYLRSNEIDILHTHSTEAGIIGRFASRLAGTETVIHEIHGDPVTDDRSRLLNYFLLKAEQLSAQFTTHFVVKSEKIKSDYISRGIGSPSQYSTICHGVNTKRFEHANSIPRFSSISCPVLLFVGRIEQGKGLYDLLNATESILQNNRLHVIIAGEGTISEAIQNEIQTRGLCHDIEMLGYRTDIPELMQSADFLCLPSYREGTPRVITEALAAGLPVISTKIAGIPGQVDHGRTGLLFRPGDISSLKDHIRFMMEQENRKPMAELAPKTVEKYNPERISQQYLSLYRNLARQ